MISSFVIVKKNNPFFVVLFGRNIWPAGFGGFAIYTTGKYVSIKLGLANLTQVTKVGQDYDKVDIKEGSASKLKKFWNIRHRFHIYQSNYI